MPLETLHQLLISLRQTIQEESAMLSQNEALTRYALIDPLLRELGWDTANPKAVIPEYPIDIYGGNRARADYALLDDKRNPLVMIEAKKLGEPLLTGKAVNQGMQACLNTNTPFFAATDGDHWTIYDMLKQAMPAEKLIVEFTISAEPPEQTMLKALALNRLSAAYHAAMARANAIASSTYQTQAIADIRTPPQSAAPRGIPLSEIFYKSRDPAPTAIIFPDRKEIPTKDTWADAGYKIIDYLISNNILTAKLLPVGSDRTTFIDDKPTHPDGRPFKVARQIGAFHINMDTSPSALLNRIKYIMSAAGHNPADYRLVFKEQSN